MARLIAITFHNETDARDGLITTLIGTYLLFCGVARIVIALFDRREGWGRGVLRGVVSARTSPRG